MNQEIKVSEERERGCGFRMIGGTYLVSGGIMLPCGGVPMELHVCPVCRSGIKPSRGWTWVRPLELFEPKMPIFPCGESHCADCPVSGPPLRAGLIWIGATYYAGADDWIAEAKRMGVSRRISAIPKDFQLGITWVFVAHQKGLARPCDDCEDAASFKTEGNGADCPKCGGTGLEFVPAIFHAFQPTAIERIVAGDESDEEIERITKAGMTPVKVIPIREGAGDHADA